MHFFQLLLHIDVFLATVVNSFGAWSYVILFCVVFFERGCILTPFLPGDSLLFAAGALTATSQLEILPLMLSLTSACFVGVLINYWLGYRFGEYIQHLKNSSWIKKEHLYKAHVFFEKYGVFAIIICCFIPVIRTFTPFVAGIGKMSPCKYILISLLSSCVWIMGILWLSYIFGNTPFVRHYFSWLILGMIIVPTSIPIFSYAWQRCRALIK